MQYPNDWIVYKISVSRACCYMQGVCPDLRTLGCCALVRAVSSNLSDKTEPNNLRRVLDAFNLALTIHAMYYYLVLHFSNIDALIHIVWYVRPIPSNCRLVLNLRSGVSRFD
jgi:hypothetical protein